MCVYVCAVVCFLYFLLDIYAEDSREQPGAHTMRMDTSLSLYVPVEPVFIYSIPTLILHDTPLTPGRRRLGKRYVGECRVEDYIDGVRVVVAVRCMS